MDSERMQLVHKAEAILRDLTNEFEGQCKQREEQRNSFEEEKKKIKEALEGKKKELQSLVSKENGQEDVLQKTHEIKKQLEKQIQEMANLNETLANGQSALEKLRDEHKESKDRLDALESDIARIEVLKAQQTEELANVSQDRNEANKLVETLAFLEQAGRIQLVSRDSEQIVLSVTLNKDAPPLLITLHLDYEQVTQVSSTICNEEFVIDEKETKRLIKKQQIATLVLLLKDSYSREIAFRTKIRDLKSKYAIDWLPQKSMVSVMIPSKSKDVTMVMINVNQSQEDEQLLLNYVIGPYEDTIRKNWQHGISLSDCIEHLHVLVKNSSPP